MANGDYSTAVSSNYSSSLKRKRETDESTLNSFDSETSSQFSTSSNSDRYNHSNTKNFSKRVRFHSKVKVVLIPSITEYKEANIKELLWWNSSDYQLSYIESTSNVEKENDLSVNHVNNIYQQQ
mmetsp:Transcript_7237/g.10223  ORF Transcript_7237/g.10223 Transcript_7237/m.10223 type:complete len:124 (-) Transcript_7237:243-614(-)